MPRRNGTGPLGQGPMTGRGLGNCTGVRSAQYGLGLGFGRGVGCRRGFGGNYYQEPIAYKPDKDFLADQKKYLKDRLDIINSQLEELAEDSK